MCRVTMSDITEGKRASGDQRGLPHDLGERVKELNCLYSITNFVESPGFSLEEVLQGTSGLIPPAWQYPEVTCARLLMDGQEYSRDNFSQSPWQQTAGILVVGEKCGTIQVGYLERKTRERRRPLPTRSDAPAQCDDRQPGQAR